MIILMKNTYTYIHTNIYIYIYIYDVLFELEQSLFLTLAYLFRVIFS